MEETPTPQNPSKQSLSKQKAYEEGKWCLANKKMTCDTCGKTCDYGNYLKWHGDKCKYKWLVSSPSLLKRRK